MSLDGIVVKSIVDELNTNLLNGRIDKIYQPEKDEIILSIRNEKITYKVILSASSNNPRIHISNLTKNNPKAPPMFCMLLRKHIQGGKITNITQTSFERIINLHIKSYDELGILKEKLLTIEIMGRHSNIILIDKESNNIIDSIKRVPPSVSSVRQVLPGYSYILPPNDKLNPILVDKNTFINKLETFNEGVLVYKFLYQSFMGVSPLISKEICFLSKIDSNTKLGENIDIDKLYKSFSNLFDTIRKNEFEPIMVFEKDSKRVIEFSAIKLFQFNNVIMHRYDSTSLMLEDYYVKRDNYDRISQKSAGFKKSISTKIDRTKNKLLKQKQELLNATKRDKYKVFGDLIISNIYRIEDKQKELICENFYNNNEKINIILDPRLNPSQNAQKYYKKYNKLKNASILVSKEIEKTKEDLDYLENIMLSIENCTNIKELEEIKEELVKEGFLKSKNKSKNKKSDNVSSNPRHYISSDGIDIYVGKNNKQNDYLTLKFADKNDLWLHTKQIPGSHVIIKSKGLDVPDTTLREAANIAAFFSKGKMSSNVPVDYTERKNVKKPNGSKPGMVIYDNNNTIYITPNENEINNLEKIE